MPRDASNGWADVFEDELDDGPRTDPSSGDDGPDALHHDPVLAAMAELDGVRSIPANALDTARATERARAPPSDDVAPPARAEPASPASPPSLGLALPVPSEPASPPAPSPSGGGGGRDVLAALSLDGPEDDAAGPTATERRRRRAPLDRTYRDVGIAVMLGGLLLVASIVYTRSQAEPTPARVASRPEAPRPAAPEPAPEPPAAPPELAEKKPPAAPVRRMMSILSQPSGGLVEVNGVLFGRTPLVKPAPADRESLEVVIRLDGHRRWVQTARPNDAGHFHVRAELAPLR